MVCVLPISSSSYSSYSFSLHEGTARERDNAAVHSFQQGLHISP